MKKKIQKITIEHEIIFLKKLISKFKGTSTEKDIRKELNELLELLNCL
jgi:hypothetical protein